MKLINLTQGKFAQVDDDDYEFLMQWKWYIHVSKNNNYVCRSARIGEYSNKRCAIKMHRVILGITDSKVFVDHKDHNGLNNQKNNLRVATRSQNNTNRKSKRNGTSIYLGVSKFNNKWRASIRSNGNYFYIGLFISEIDAAKAYDKKAMELHGKWANFNF